MVSRRTVAASDHRAGIQSARTGGFQASRRPRQSPPVPRILPESWRHFGAPEEARELDLGAIVLKALTGASFIRYQLCSRRLSMRRTHGVLAALALLVSLLSGLAACSAGEIPAAPQSDRKSVV